MRRRVWKVRISGNHAYVSGYGIRDAVVELKGRAPVWSRSEKAWVVQPRTAHDLVALGETRGHEVVVSGPSRRTHDQDLRHRGGPSGPADAVASPPAEVGLW